MFGCGTAACVSISLVSMVFNLPRSGRNLSRSRWSFRLFYAVRVAVRVVNSTNTFSTNDAVHELGEIPSCVEVRGNAAPAVVEAVEDDAREHLVGQLDVAHR